MHPYGILDQSDNKNIMAKSFKVGSGHKQACMQSLATKNSLKSGCGTCESSPLIGGMKTHE